MKWLRYHRAHTLRIESLRRAYAVSFALAAGRPVPASAVATYVRTGDAAALESAAGVPRAT